MDKVRHFGFDLDNTLIDYSFSCREYAEQSGLPKVTTIGELRELLKAGRDESETWTSAQSWIYGEGLQYAFISESSINFLKTLVEKGWTASIHSHKTEFGPSAYGRVPFRALMQDWLELSPLKHFFDLNSNVYFYADLDSKILGITVSKLDCYVDDLPRIFRHPEYPRSTRSYLYRSRDEELDWVHSIHSFEEIKID